MKNFGMEAGATIHKCAAAATRAGSQRSLGGKGKPIRKRIRPQPLLHFPIGPGEGALLVEDRDADDADVARVVIFLLRIRFAHRPEAKCGDRLCALAKSFHHQRLPRENDIAAFPDRSRTTIDYLEAAD